MVPGHVARAALALAVVAAATVVAGCAREVDGPVLVLRLASPDREQDATGIQVTRFAEEVAERSGGTIRIEPVWDVTPGTVVHDWDQQVARGVADGAWDLGLVPGRAWDELGVDSLRPLSAPFLVTSTEALREVLDSDLRDDLLADLPDAGVVGLDLFPDSLRHPFGFEAPLLEVGDYAEQTIRTPSSATVRRLFEAYGATTTDLPQDAATQRGAESDFGLSEARFATGNVTFFAKTDVLAVDQDVRDRLRADQWEVLGEAAAATRVRLFEEQAPDRDLAREFCDQGGSIVAATPAQVAALEDASRSVVTWLRRDRATADLVDEVQDLVRDVEPDPPVVRCPDEQPAQVADPELSSLDGTYVSTVTARQLREAGVTNENLVRENSGRFTWVLDGGTWSYDTEADHFVSNPSDSGRYTYRDRVFTFYFTAEDAMTARLEIDRDGDIRFTDIDDPPAEAQALSEGFFQPWTRVGGVPD